MKTTQKLNLSETPVEIDAAAKTFKLGLPLYQRILNDLSMKSLKRLCNAIVEYPLHDEKSPLLQNAELPAFELAVELMEARAVMMEYSTKEIHKQEMARAAKEETKKEVENG